MEIKLSIANLAKLKHKLGLKFGDEQAFDKTIRDVILKANIVNKIQEKISLSTQSQKKATKVQDDTEEQTKRTTKFMKDQLKLSLYSDIGEILPSEVVLARLRNECFVDIQCLETNKKRLAQLTDQNNFGLGV